MISGVQKILLELGKSGCYFLSICQEARKTLDETVDAYIYCVNKGWMEKNCFIKDPESIVNYIFGANYKYKYSTELDPKADIIIVKYVRNGQTHFVLQNWDSYGEDSVIRKYGLRDSYRLFYRI